jgi:hypothetical protein
VKEIIIGYDKVIIELSKDEISSLINAFNEVYKEIDEWEFQTRMGEDLEFAKAFTVSLKLVFDKLK